MGRVSRNCKIKKEINELKESNAIIRDAKTTFKVTNSRLREMLAEKNERINEMEKQLTKVKTFEVERKDIEEELRLARISNDITHKILREREEENKKLGKQIDLLRDNIQELVKSNIELSNYWKQEYNRSIALDAELMRITRANKQYINNFEKLIRKQEKEIEEFKGYKESVRTYTRQLEETAAFWIKKYWNNR